MNQLVTIPQPAFNMSDIERVALAIAQGGLFGSRDPQAVLTLCLLAHAEGQHPAVVFRDYHIIQGKPAKKAEAILRDFINAGGKVEWHELTDDKADATFTHPSGSARIDWTLKRAQQAGINNPMWKKYPRQMLRSRVISEGVRTVFPGATSGLYEEGEVRDMTPAVETQDGGVIEGQFEQREVSPDSPATTTTDAEPVNDRAARGRGNGPTKSALDRAENEIVHELNGCGDEDSLIAYLETEEYKAAKALLEEHRPSALYGPPPADCPEYVHIKKRIADMLAEFRSPAREPSALDAG